jgi:hypothetical protein
MTIGVEVGRGVEVGLGVVVGAGVQVGSMSTRGVEVNGMEVGDVLMVGVAVGGVEQAARMRKIQKKKDERIKMCLPDSCGSAQHSFQARWRMGG